MTAGPRDADELTRLRQELWQARDAVIGATATAGSFQARNTELEMLVQQLRKELVARDAELAALRGSRSLKVARILRRVLG